jgi:integrase
VSRGRPAGRPPRQAPYRRRYENGGSVWIARFRDLDGRTRYAKPRWNGNKSTFALKGEAQRAIDEALEQLYGLAALEPQTIGSFDSGWLRIHPRSQRTNETYAERISAVLDIELEGRALRDWQFDELRRRHVQELIDHLLRQRGRTVQGVRGILATFSAMAEDAIADEVAELNAFRGLRLRRDDPRARTPSRPIRIWSFEQIREFAGCARPEVRTRTRRPLPVSASKQLKAAARPRYFSRHDYEAMILTLGLTGVRLGELLALRIADYDGESLQVRRSAHEGRLVPSNPYKNHDRDVPVPPSLAVKFDAIAAGAEGELFFPTPRGKLWRERNFYRDVWEQARLASGLDPIPHEFRHSYVSQLRAAGIDDADLALITGHSVETMVSRYTHALARSSEAVRSAIG